MKLRAVLPAALGAGFLAWLLWRTGVPAVLVAAGRIGLAGFAFVLLFQLVLSVLEGLAWALLGRGRADAAPSRFVWARLVRDGATQALPFTQVGGLALGGRALALEGVAGAFATASTLTDMAIEFVTEVAYATLGALLLQALRPQNLLGRPVLFVLGGLVLMAGGLVWAQASGASFVGRMVRRVTRRNGTGGDTVEAAFAGMRRRPAALAGGFVLHLCAWCLTGVMTWIILRLMGSQAPLGGALAIDSLTSGAKAVAFLVPGALGVQEGALVLLGQLFGVSAADALALSLIRRGRDLVLAVPVLAIWQARWGEAIWTLR